MSIRRVLEAFGDGDIDAAIRLGVDIYREAPNGELAEVLDHLGFVRMRRWGGWGESGKKLEARFLAEAADPLEAPAAAAALYRLSGSKLSALLRGLDPGGDPRWVTWLGPLLFGTLFSRPEVIEGVRQVWRGVTDTRKRRWIARSAEFYGSHAWQDAWRAIGDDVGAEREAPMPEPAALMALWERLEAERIAWGDKLGAVTAAVRAGDHGRLAVLADQLIESGEAYGELLSLQLADLASPLSGSRRTRMNTLISQLSPVVAPGLVCSIRKLTFREGLPWSGIVPSGFAPSLPDPTDEPMIELLGDVEIEGREIGRARTHFPGLQPHPTDSGRFIDPERFQPPKVEPRSLAPDRLQKAMHRVELESGTPLGVEPGEAALVVESAESAVVVRVHSIIEEIEWVWPPDVRVGPGFIRVSVVPEATRLERKAVQRDVWGLVALAYGVDAPSEMQDGTHVLAGVGHRVCWRGGRAVCRECALLAGLHRSGLPKRGLPKRPAGAEMLPRLPRPRFGQQPHANEDGVEWRIDGMPHARFRSSGVMQLALWGHDFPGEKTKTFGRVLGGAPRWVEFAGDDLYWLGRSAEHTRRVLARLATLRVSAETRAQIVGAYREERMSDDAVREALALGPLEAGPFWTFVDLWRVAIPLRMALLRQGRARLRELFDPSWPVSERTWRWYDLDLE